MFLKKFAVCETILQKLNFINNCFKATIRGTPNAISYLKAARQKESKWHLSISTSKAGRRATSTPEATTSKFGTTRPNRPDGDFVATKSLKLFDQTPSF